MTALRDKLADMNRYDGWRRRERIREIDREEDEARELARDIRTLQAKVERIRPDDSVDRKCWSDIVDLLSDAATTADQIVSAARTKSDDVAAGVDE